jgi:WD40 repeat protein
MPGKSKHGQGAQRRIQVLMGLILFIVIVTGGWIIHRTRAVAHQTSLVLASAATTANDAGVYDRAMRFAILAMGKSWLAPGSVEAEPELMRGAQTSMQIALLSGHQDAVDSAVFSPDGKRVVTASWDRTARVWDVATGKQIVRFSGHQDLVYSAAFSPDGRRVLTASDDKTARVWDAATGQVIAQLTGHLGPVFSAVFSADGQRVVTASDDKTVRVWDAATGHVIAQLTGHLGPVNSAAFSPDGQRLVTASRDRTARAWDSAIGILLLSGHKGWVYSAAFSPDGQRVVTASADHTARVWPIRWLMQNRGRSLAKAVCKEKLAGASLITTDDEAALPLVRGRLAENVCGS